MNYDYKEIVPYLLHWFEYNARILPWREDPKPYYVWVSEIMLQQTRVEAVKGYFDRFTTMLPDIETLAECPEEKLLKLWEGLGYYNRVRNLQKAARLIMKEYEGKLPADYEKLLKLPGIGTYTAGAIASIAFHIPVPAVDGNVLRVAKRIAASYDDISKESVKKQLWQDLMEVMPQDNPGEFNQSLMELGAMVCLPNGKPLCSQCPVMHLCKAFHQDVVMELPVKPGKKERKQEKKTILVMEYGGRYALQKRENKGLLAGLWGLPGLEDNINPKELYRRLSDLGLEIESIQNLGNARHIFSHIEWHMLGYYIRLKNIPAEAKLQANNQENTEGETQNDLSLSKLVWADQSELQNRYALPNAFSAYIDPLRTSTDINKSGEYDSDVY